MMLSDVVHVVIVSCINQEQEEWCNLKLDKLNVDDIFSVKVINYVIWHVRILENKYEKKIESFDKLVL